MPATLVTTSWLRVEGPGDERTCAWCRRWRGQFIPAEMRAVFLEQHGAASKAPCRCKLAPAEAKLDAEDPGCLWA